MCGMHHSSCLHHKLRHILSQQDPQVTKIEICWWQRWGLLCLLQKRAPCALPLRTNSEIYLPFLRLLIRPCNTFVRSNSETIPLSNKMAFGSGDFFFFLIRKTPHGHHLLIAIFEESKRISKDVVQEPIWKKKKLFVPKQMEFGLIVEINCHMEQNTADYCINTNVNMLHHSVVIVATVVTRL